MNKKQILGLFFLFMFHVIGVAQNYENQAVKCIVDKYNAKEIQIDTVLNNYENYLVKTEYLIQNKEKRYRSFFMKMKKKNAFIAVIPKITYDKISKVNPDEYLDKKCFSKIKGFKIKDFLLFHKFIVLGKNMQIKSESNSFTAKDTASLFLETFSDKDFNNPFVRTILLLMISQIAWVDDGGSMPSFELLPPISR